MKNLACFALLALLFAVPSAAFPQSSTAQPDYAAIGRETVSAMAQGHWGAVEARFDQRMKTALPRDKLAAVWGQITAQAGAFQRISGVNLGEKAGYHVAMVLCAFANSDLDAKIVMDSTGRVAGLFFVPPAAPAASASGKQPDYAGIGRATVAEIAQGQWNVVEAQFDQRMKTALPQSKLSSVWQQITGKVGAFKSITGVKLSEQAGYHVAMVACSFANSNLDAKVVIDSTGHIAGLFFLPPATSASM
jgi:hypothetical protein